MASKIFFILTLLTLPLAQGCSHDALLEKLTPTEEIDFAKDYFTLFQDENYEEIEVLVDKNLHTPDLRQKLEKMAAIFPKVPPQGIELVGSRTFESENKWKATLTFQYEFPKTWLLANIVLEKVTDGPLVVKGVNVTPLLDSLQNTHKFKLRGKSITHYVFLAFSVLIPLFIVSTFIVCLRTPIKKRKWLWMIFILFGFMQCALNWTNGALFCQLLSVNLLGAGFFYGNEFSPVILKVAIPLGAIIFWIKRKKLLQQTT